MTFAPWSWSSLSTVKKSRPSVQDAMRLSARNWTLLRNEGTERDNGGLWLKDSNRPVVSEMALLASASFSGRLFVAAWNSAALFWQSCCVSARGRQETCRSVSSLRWQLPAGRPSQPWTSLLFRDPCVERHVFLQRLLKQQCEC